MEGFGLAHSILSNSWSASSISRFADLHRSLTTSSNLLLEVLLEVILFFEQNEEEVEGAAATAGPANFFHLFVLAATKCPADGQMLGPRSERV